MQGAEYAGAVADIDIVATKPKKEAKGLMIIPPAE
jgi:hypothetical protein